MGCWNETCAVSGLPIFAGDPVVGVMMVKDSPLPFWWVADYNDYGWYENIFCPVEEDMNHWLNTNAVQGSRMASLSVLNEREPFKVLRTQWEDGDGDGDNEARLTHVPCTVSHVMMHRAIWDGLQNTRENPPRYGDHQYDEPMNWDRFQYLLEDIFTRRDERIAAMKEKFTGDGADEKRADAAAEFMYSMSLDSLELFRWFDSGGDLDANATWVREAHSIIREKLQEPGATFESVLDECTPYFKWRWVMYVIRWSGKRLTAPVHVGQNDNTAMVQHVLGLCLGVASASRATTDGYKGVENSG